MQEEQTLDEWQLALIPKKEALELCQKEKQIKSCLKCQEILDCKIRDGYIEAIYNSMSKGQGGGFEF